MGSVFVSKIKNGSSCPDETVRIDSQWFRDYSVKHWDKLVENPGYWAKNAAKYC